MSADEPQAMAVHVPDTATPTTMVVWVHDGPVCVGCVDLPAPCQTGGVCRCPACHGALSADLADDFFQHH